MVFWWDLQWLQCVGSYSLYLIYFSNHLKTFILKTKTGRKLTYRKIPKKSPEAYIFRRPFLRDLFLEGLIYGRKIAFQNRLRLYWERNLSLEIKGANFLSWKEIYVSNLQKVFTETRLEDVDLTKTQPCKHFISMERGNPSQESQERTTRANSNIPWHFFSTIIWHT